MDQKKAIKAAIYTRKSSEEGLELDFNSLDAQREACEAYIISQKHGTESHAGWVLVDKEYSDGGISGGTLERPAIKELLQDIKDGLVDMIVVYKIDRLTRSLHDFSKLVEIFDKHQTSFVSITQQFNTSTSMGRLTLNMLLSFAQFEREVTGERIRDKKLATAKKGLWGSGGNTSFGYKSVPTNPDISNGSKKIIPNDIEAPKLKRIFELYLELKSVQELMYRLKDEQIFTRNGKPFTGGNLYQLLKRKVYIGKIEHKGQVYDGIHEPIIDLEIFNQVQELLANNCQSHKRRYKSKQPSLLASKLYDDNDFMMSPSHAVKNNKRYRYYLSQAYLQKKKELAGSLAQVPASELEGHASFLIKQKLEEQLRLDNSSIEQYELYKKNLENYLGSWSLQDKETHFIVRAIIHKVVISRHGCRSTRDDMDVKIEGTHINIIYYINSSSLQELFDLIVTKQDINNYEVLPIDENDCEIIILPCELKRVNQGKSLIIGGENKQKNKGLIELLKKAWEWSGKIENSVSIKEIAQQEKVSTSYISKVLKLRFLSPRIQKMILLGERSDILTSHYLRMVTSINFKEQEQQIGL
ncbi:MAG: recombinase family protein [Brevinema sp.]